MLHQHILIALLAATSVSAVPLNINLGAYSPALVVGDGEISFAGTDGAGNLIEELESGAVSAGQQNGEATPSAAPSEGNGANIISPSEQAKASRSKRAIESFSQLTATQRTTFRRDIAGFREALNYAIQAQKNTPKIELGTENAGVGILVNPGLNVPQGSAAAGSSSTTGGAAGKRSVEGVSEGGERAGITLLAIAEI
ncbi:hypothetical protein EV356DRAFT_451848 [Viridothelium virens]|uniref:Uncharacterized protein n=1 Tax=Viridothelium virens TaxID=1048519 RepID=A0A6A6H1E0_VIRVR|nr:hypothetical protein EV356DRAFT_451848 [Viridothelium virens]